MNQALERIDLPAGTVVKVGGMPFELAADTVVLGGQANLQLALSQSAASSAMPAQAIASPVTSITSSLDDASA